MSILKTHQEETQKELKKWIERFIDNGEDMDIYWQNSLDEFLSSQEKLLVEKIKQEINKEKDRTRCGACDEKISNLSHTLHCEGMNRLLKSLE